MDNAYTAEVAASYDAWFDTPVGARADQLEWDLIRRLARPQSGERALDVGCGTGQFSLRLGQLGLRVDALDASPDMLSVARPKSTAIAWREGSAEVLPYDAGTFDLVLSVTALEFMVDQARALREMMRVVRPGGRLVVATLNADSTWGRFYRQQATENDNDLFARTRFYTPETLLAALGDLNPKSVRWSSSVFFGPSGRGLCIAGLWEYLGRCCARPRGALLVARVDK